MPSLAEIADELYALPLAEFTRTRDAAARRIRGDGNRGLASQVTALRKASAAAWAVNALVRDRPDQIAEVLALGASLRTAQRDLDSGALRQLTSERRQLVAALARQAAEVARGLGHPLAPSAITEVEGTLQAALADSAASDAVQTGRLVRSLETVGFDRVDLAGAIAGVASADEQPGPSDDADRAAARDRARREAEQAAEEAEDAADDAESVLDGLDHLAAELARQRIKLDARVEQLRTRLVEAEADLAGIDDRARSIGHERDAAERQATGARRDAERARHEADELSGAAR